MLFSIKRDIDITQFGLHILSLKIEFDNPTVQKIIFFIKDLFSKCDQIRKKLRIWSHLLKKSLMKNFIFCAVSRKMLIYDNLANLGLP